MKKKAVILFLALVFVLVLFIKLPKAEDKINVPPGMEVIMVGDVRHIVPKGSKIKKSGGVVTVEGLNEYMARKLSDIEERISTIEEDIKELQKARSAPAEVTPASSEEEARQEED